MSDSSDEHRARLNGAKLRALVATEASRVGDPVAFAAGAAVEADGCAWVLVDGPATAALGPALAWSIRRELDELVLLGEDDLGGAARRARYFEPCPSVQRLDGRDRVAVAPADLVELAPPADVPDLAQSLRAAGLDVVVEHGNLLGEYLGLEVARVVGHDDGPRLEIGVGKYDREMTGLVHSDMPTPEALARVVEIVGQHRRADGPPHPLRRMAPERWLRHRLIGEPSLIGLTELEPEPSPFARHNLLERATAAARGLDHDGRETVVVTCVGIDLDVVATAADVRGHLAPDARLIVVVPERDDHPLIRAMAARVAGGCDVVPVPGDWRR